MKHHISGVITAFAALMVLVLPAARADADAGTVSQTPAAFTPWLLQDTPNQNVRRLVPCGSLMYAVGKISRIGQASNTYTRGNAFSFSQTTGAVTSWNPQVNGTVDDITFSPDCSTAYIGGSFTSVHGTAVANLAAVDTTNGFVRTGFKHSANAAVYTLDYTHGQVIAGGAFSSINGVARTELASLDPGTGDVTSYARVAISGTYTNSSKRVDNSQLSHSGDKLMIEGVFTSIAGNSRQQVAVFDLGASSLTLDPWYAPELTQACATVESYYARAAAWSPDDSMIYIATTGYKPLSGPGSDTRSPRAGLCDAAAGFSSAAGPQHSVWINYTGCDSYYAVGVDSINVYVGGHERWANNPLACDWAGPGAVSRPGIGSLSRGSGQATAWNPTRSRGRGADDMIITAAGLWVASDNFSDGGAQMCGHQWNHGGICFLPY